ncbi:ferric reductase [Streptomyces sp. NPDC001604]|uniref:ferric reductase n=1 Tax=Streptomyces sp. NPDC001604 TaxID=3364593 RepID=UPI00367B48F8
MGGKLLLWSLVLIFPLPLVLALNLQSTDVPSMRLYITWGLIAYSWWLLAILLSVRPTWLGRGVGLPSVYALHGMLGVFALVPAYLHKENTFAPDDLSRLLGDWGFYAALAVLCYSVVFMSGWLTDRSRLALKVKSRLETVFRRRLSVWIHRLNLVVVLMIWLHVHLIGRVNQHFWFMTLFDLYTVVVLGTYVWKKWVAPDSFLTGAVQENVALNDSTRQIAIALHRTATASRPGDFYFLSFDDTGLGREWHPFSATDERHDVLTFTIRQTGDYTSKIGSVVPGTAVRLEGPFGRFDSVLKARTDDTPLVLVGMGAGIAPLLSLTAEYLTARRIHLLWSVRRADDAYYSRLLEQYEHRSGGLLTVTTQVGRFHRNQLSTVLAEEEVTRGEFFVVGPNPAVLATQRMLRRIGVSRSRIHHERLTM